MNCRGLAKRVMSPSSATSVAAATSARPAALAALSPPAPATNPPARPRCGLQDGPAGRRRLDGRDAIFQHDVMRRVFELQSGQPAPVHQRPGRPVIMMAMAQQEAGQLLARLPHRLRTAARRARTRSRIASWAGSGTQTGVSSPARCSLARLIASRRSVLIRSPGLRGINDGATTTHSCPASLSCR